MAAAVVVVAAAAVGRSAAGQARATLTAPSKASHLSTGELAETVDVTVDAYLLVMRDCECMYHTSTVVTPVLASCMFESHAHYVG
jgi:hypothetical protein